MPILTFGKGGAGSGGGSARRERWFFCSDRRIRSEKKEPWVPGKMIESSCKRLSKRSQEVWRQEGVRPKSGSSGDSKVLKHVLEC